MFGWIKESAVYEVGYISNDSWDEETSSYKVDIPEVVLFEASTVIEKGYLFLIHGTIETSDGTTEIFLQANKLEKQSTPDGDVIYISFADGSTLTEGLLTIPYSEEGSSGIKNIWDSTGEGAVAGGNMSAVASGDASFAFGTGASASAIGAFAFGTGARATGRDSFAVGATTASGVNSHAEGNATIASGARSHAEGAATKAYGTNSHAEGEQTEAGSATNTKNNSHAEGLNTKATGEASHAEGLETQATGERSHSEGGGSIASGSSSHAEGAGSTASGGASHAEGAGTTASGETSHAEGLSTKASGSCSHAEGAGTIANGPNQHVGGIYNVADTTSLEIIGNGTGSNNRSNVRTLDQSGNEWLAGQIQPELGLRLKAPNGTYYNVTVDNTGALSITAVT